MRGPGPTLRRLDPHLRQRLCERLEAHPRCRLAVVFGSEARGEARADSDLDIGWVPFESGLALGDELELQADLTRIAGVEVDLVRLDRASTLVKMEVARDGVLLLGERRDWTGFRAGAISEFLDFEPALRSASRVFKARLRSRGEAS